MPKKMPLRNIKMAPKASWKWSRAHSNKAKLYFAAQLVLGPSLLLAFVRHALIRRALKIQEDQKFKCVSPLSYMV